MGYKPISTKVWERWLISRGLVRIRIKASHHIWDYPDKSLLRPVVFQGELKEIPGFHIDKCLKTLGVSYAVFMKEISEF